MEAYDDIFKLLPRLYGTNIGCGANLDIAALERTGQPFTGYEIIEANAVDLAPKCFKVEDLLKDLRGDIELVCVIMLDPPTQHNQLGRYRFVPNHYYLIHDLPPDKAPRVKPDL